MTKVYIFKIDKDFKNLFNYYINEIPLHLKEEVCRFKFIADKHRTLAGKLLIRFALCREGYNTDVLSKVKRDNFNRPYLNRDIDFNISHSGSYVVCSITNNGLLGVDIEFIQHIEIENYMHFFKGTEIFEIDNRMENFYRLWTQKEAICKAVGKGLSINLEDILIKGNKGIFMTDFWYLKKIDIHHEYMFCLACKDELNPKIINVDNYDLVI
jgi:4'-phosphopantetheinyl transferase